MNQVAAFEAPELPKPDEEAIRREQRAFFRMLPELLKTHRGQYVAIYEERVVESGANELDVLDRAYQKYGGVPMWVSIVAEAGMGPSRVPHYRPLSSGSSS